MRGGEYMALPQRNASCRFYLRGNCFGPWGGLELRLGSAQWRALLVRRLSLHIGLHTLAQNGHRRTHIFKAKICPERYPSIGTSMAPTFFPTRNSLCVVGHQLRPTLIVWIASCSRAWCHGHGWHRRIGNPLACVTTARGAPMATRPNLAKSMCFGSLPNDT